MVGSVDLPTSSSPDRVDQDMRPRTVSDRVERRSLVQGERFENAEREGITGEGDLGFTLVRPSFHFVLRLEDLLRS